MHQDITNAFRKNIPYGFNYADDLTEKILRDALEDVYGSYPQLKRIALDML